jgi:putative phage-type endonuclease
MELYAPQEFNKAKLLGVFENGSPEWHEARLSGIGGSEIGTIMGLNPWESAFTLWHKRAGLIETEQLTSMAVRLGNKLETPVLEIFAEEHPGFEVYTTGTYQSVETKYLQANPDGLAKTESGEWVIVEVKTSRNYWDEVPPAYVAQVQHYMNVMGLKTAVIVALVGMDYKEYWIERDQFAIDNQELYAREFWDGLRNGVVPSWDGSESTFETVRKLHPLIDDTEVEIDGGHYLVLAQEKLDQATAEFMEAKSRVMSAMGNAKHAYVTHDGQQYRIASRQARGMSAPYLVVNKKGIK